MQKKLKVGLPETDHRALLKCVAVYTKMSRRNSAELTFREKVGAGLVLAPERD